MVRGFDAVDTSAGEINESGGAVELFAPPLEGAAIPANVVPGAGDGGGLAGDQGDAPPQVREMMCERNSQKTTATRDHNSSEARFECHVAASIHVMVVYQDRGSGSPLP